MIYLDLFFLILIHYVFVIHYFSIEEKVAYLNNYNYMCHYYFKDYPHNYCDQSSYIFMNKNFNSISYETTYFYIFEFFFPFSLGNFGYPLRNYNKE